MADNSVTLVGNLTRDPELRFTQSGVARAQLGLAVNRRWLNRQTNDWDEATSFFNIVCWRDLAEHVGESLRKGARVIVTGRLDQRSWETDQGDQRTMIEVAADDVGPSLRWATVEVKKPDRREAEPVGVPAAASGAASDTGSGGEHEAGDEQPF